MIETVVQTALPVDELLKIKKNRLTPEVLKGDEKRICVVTGTHGDELEGQYVCYELARRIRQNKGHLKGIVDIYPALNPLGIDSISRGIPKFDLDMNRIFPGSDEGSMAEFVAERIVKDIEGANLCIDIHASNIFLKEIPQVRISEETAEVLVPLAKYVNVDFVWIYQAATVLEATLAHTMNTRGVPTLVVEMGVGMRLTKSYGEQLINGIFSLMKQAGIWDGDVPKVREPIISSDGKVSFINAKVSGLFIPVVEHGKMLKKGEHIGDIIDPLHGTIVERIESPVEGLLFTRREYPVVTSGSLIARILGGITE